MSFKPFDWSDEPLLDYSNSLLCLVKYDFLLVNI